MKGSSGCRDNVILEDNLVCFNPNKGALFVSDMNLVDGGKSKTSELWEHGFPFSFHVETLSSTACSMSLVQATVRRITAVE